LEENVAAMTTKSKSANLLAVGLTSPLQSLSGQVDKPDQENDLLSFWHVGQTQFKDRI